MSYDPYPITVKQAYVALVVQEAGEVPGNEGRSLGRTTLQKVLYFLQVRGVPVRYKFDVHHFGPFCAEILQDAEWLSAFDVIEDNSDSPEKHSDYRITDSGAKLLDTFAQDLQSHRATVKSIVSALVPMDTDELELISTLHYVFREIAASKEESPSREEVKTRFKEFKKSKFQDARIDSAWERMIQVKLLSTC